MKVAHSNRSIFDKLVRNKDGKIVLAQPPNLPLWGWIIFTILAMLVTSQGLQAGLHSLSQALLFTWAYMELRSGESLFRRLLGSIVLLVIIYGYIG